MFDHDPSGSPFSESASSFSYVRIDSSASAESTSRLLADEVARAWQEKGGLLIANHRLDASMPHIDQSWIQAAYTDPNDRSSAQHAALERSNQYIDELRRADRLLISSPVYNFAIPSTLKAWIDQVARARETFRYTENGPEGLLKNKQAVVVISSGGTEPGSDIDFAWRYLKHALAFIGITDVQLISADRQMIDQQDALKRARHQIQALDTQANEV